MSDGECFCTRLAKACVCVDPCQDFPLLRISATHPPTPINLSPQPLPSTSPHLLLLQERRAVQELDHGTDCYGLPGNTLLLLIQIKPLRVSLLSCAPREKLVVVLVPALALPDLTGNHSFSSLPEPIPSFVCMFVVRSGETVLLSRVFHSFLLYV